MWNSSGCCAFEFPILHEVLPPVLIMIFIFGVMLNTVAFCMFAFCLESWKPNTIYLVNMAAADSVMLFFMPFRADYYIRGQNWIFGDVLCRILIFLLTANRAASIFFLTAVAVDRYLKIVHPLHRINRMNLKYAKWVAAGLWALVLLMTTQLLFSSHFFILRNHTQCESFNICLDNRPLSVWHSAFFVIQFCVTGSIMIFCTVCITWQLKTKTIDTTGKVKRAVQFIFIVAMVFLICFFPSTALQVVIWILHAWYHKCSHFSEANQFFYVSICLTYFNSVVNPLVYYFSTPTFSAIIQEFFRRLFQGKKKRQQNEQ